MKRFVSGIGSLVLLAVLIIGIPAGLIAVAGNPFPSIDELTRALTLPDYGGQFLIGTLLPLVAWVAWATFAIGFLIELPAQIRGIDAPTLPGLGLQQRGAAALIATVLLMLPSAPALAQTTAGTADALADSGRITASQAYEATTAVPAEMPAEAASAPVEEAPEVAAAPRPTYTVQSGDSLWRIAEKHLGAGNRYPEIAQLNYGVVQADGHALDRQHWLNTGWVLTLPADAPAAATTGMVTASVGGEVTVEAGDTLWGIAEEKLGDGARYPEIFDATASVAQPDGQHLTDPDLIQPGWSVEVPGTAPVSDQLTPSPAPAAPAPVEAPAAAAPVPAPSPAPAAPAAEAPAASTETPAPVDLGTDRDDLDAPVAGDAAPDTATPDATTPNADDQVERDLSGLGLEVTSPESIDEVPTGSSVDVDEAEDADWVDDISIPWTTVGGIGGILAAGLLSVLGIRRLKQRRLRRPGQRISMPADEISTMELELRAVENPMGMDDVDHVLRHLAVWSQDTGIALPPIYAIRLAPTQMSLYLDGPSDLPEPFIEASDDRLAWVINPADLPELDRIPTAPYPALVTLGQDDTDAHLLIDLEHIGALNLTGAPEDTTGALTAIALELATSRWSEDVQVTLVGVAEGLPEALDTGRVRHVDDVDTLLRNLRGQARDTLETLNALGLTSIEEARSLGEESEGWIPEIVILGQLPEQAIQDELAELVMQLPRVGIAAVTTGHLAGEWTLEIGAERTAMLHPLGLPLRPQTINAEEYGKILELIRVTDQDAVEGPGWAAHIEQDEIPLDDLVIVPATLMTPATTDEHLEVEEDADDWKDALRRVFPPAVAGTASTALAPTVYVDAEPSETQTGEHLKAEAAPIGAPSTTSIEDVSAPDETPAEDAPSDAAGDPFQGNPIRSLHSAPYVRLLGPVTVQGTRGPEPRTTESSPTNRSTVNRATELIAYLALHPGATASDVHEVFWPGQSPKGDKAAHNRNGLTHKARKWLGSNNQGEPYFPRVKAEGYRLSGVTTDWDIWLELIGDDVTKTSTENLVAALRLINGQPMTSVNGKGYRWAIKLGTDMLAATGDAAHELATRSLRIGDIKNARLAAAVGREIDPVNELFWRDALRAEHQAGGVGVDRVITQLEEHLDSFDEGYEVEPATTELIREIRERAIAS